MPRIVMVEVETEHDDLIVLDHTYRILAPPTVVLDLGRIARIREHHGFTAPARDNLDSKLLMSVGEIIEAQNEVRAGRPIDATYIALKTGWWCKAHHRTMCHAPECAASAGHLQVGTAAPSNWEQYELSSPEGVGIEIADAIMRLGDIAFALGIDLQACLNAKMAYNEARPTGHGKTY